MTLFLSACAYEPTSIKKTPRDLGTQQHIGRKLLAPIKPSLEKIKQGHLKTPEFSRNKISTPFFSKTLIGLTPLEVAKFLGAPHFKRAEKPASIWQYQSETCLLDIFFFSDNSNLIVDHIEIRSKTIKKTEDTTCFSSILPSKN